MATTKPAGAERMGRSADPEGPLAQRSGSPWLLMIPQLPAKPDYLRVKVWRRLRRMGAVAMKNSVWVLPRTDAALEDFQWLLKEIAADGAEALLCEAAFLAGLTSAQSAALERLRTVAAEAGTPALPAGGGSATSSGGYRGRLWVTRPGVHIDRIASAWLIRRWIDAEARFDFRAEAAQAAVRGELRFDMFEGEFTHEGDRCTFEVLAGRFAPGDGALARIAEIVHDIDLRDRKFEPPEAPGVARLIDGVCARYATDLERIDAGAALLDDLYAAFAGASA